MTEQWVINFGATDHMTVCASLFCSYKPSQRNLKIKIADGSLTTVSGTGTWFGKFMKGTAIPRTES